MGGHDDAGAEQFAGAAGVLEDDGLVIPEYDVETSMVCLASSMRSTMNKTRSAFPVSRNRRIRASAEKRFPRTGGHLQEKLALSLLVELPRDLVDGLDLVVVQTQVGFEALEVVGLDDFRQQEPRRMEVLLPLALQVVGGGQPLDTVGVLFIRLFQVPEPVHLPIGEDYEGRLQFWAYPRACTLAS